MCPLTAVGTEGWEIKKEGNLYYVKLTLRYHPFEYQQINSNVV